MNFHSVKVDRSVVGAINTGNVKKMEVALNNIHLTNQSPELEQHLKQFAEEVLAEAALSVDSKNEIVDARLSVPAPFGNAWNRALRSVDASDGVPMWHEFGLAAAGRPPLANRDPSQCSR